MPAVDPYTLDNSRIVEPPRRLRGSVRYLGPGFILSASIVGSGELVATTTLGANAGFAAMWVILVSCLVKLPFSSSSVNGQS
jgi:manganese transport protein